MNKNRFLLGFSLLELLVVVLIIGVLVGISVPLYLRNAEQAMGAKALENLQNFFNAEMMFMVDNETFTGVRADLESYSPIGPDDADWMYVINAPAQDTFIATAIRTSPNASYNTLQISINEDSVITYPGGADSYPP